MSDETTLLPCPFCGGEIPAPTRRYMSVLICPTCNAYGPGNSDMTNDELIAAWNARATHGTLTAEQVEEAINNHCQFTVGCIVNVQAIADELNAELGSGTCKQEERGWSTEGDHARVWLTCGHDCMVPTVADLPNFCPVCGKSVKL